MKRSLAFGTMILLVFAVGGFAEGQGIGAVRGAFDPDVGWAIVNTTASGRLNITAHLDNGRPNQEFGVSVRVRYEDGTVTPYKDIGVLSANDEGKGNFHGHLDIDPPAGSTTLRRVAVRVRRPGPPQILYIAVIWDIPLK
jgi:hypothetical protein